jgi:hypothetical protein
MRVLERRKIPLAPDEVREYVFWVPGGMPLMLDVEGAIAKSLELRGHRVHAVICNGAFKACIRREATLNPDLGTWASECAACRESCERKLRQFGIEYSFIGDHVNSADLARLREVASSVSWDKLPWFEYDGVNIGRNIKSAVLRYFKGAKYNGDPELLREYVFSGLVTLVAARNLYGERRPAGVFMSHGIYVDWGPALRVALAKGIRTSCWGGSYLQGHFYFRHPSDYRGDLDFHKLSDATWAQEGNGPLTEAESRRLDTYLTERYVRGRSFDLKRPKTYRGEVASLRSRLGLREGRKVWGILTHVNWDAVTDYAPMLFEDFDEWILHTLKKLESLTEVDWVVKIHPAEAWDNPGTGIQALVARHYPRLPSHIRLIGYDDDVSPLDFFQLLDGAVTVYGTAGLELACTGKPVILAGEAHYGGKGFTHDAQSLERYFELLAAAQHTGALSAAQRQIALRYAYIYFIRRQIPFPPVENPDANRERGFWKFDIKRAGMLLPGVNPHVDFIVQHIVDHGEFILPEELLSGAQDGTGPVQPALPEQATTL